MKCVEQYISSCKAMSSSVHLLPHYFTVNLDMYLLSFTGIGNSMQQWHLSNNNILLLKVKIMK